MSVDRCTRIRVQITEGDGVSAMRTEDEDADIVFSPMADMPGALPVSSSPHSTASSSKAAEDSEPKVSEEEKVCVCVCVCVACQ